MFGEDAFGQTAGLRPGGGVVIAGVVAEDRAVNDTSSATERRVFLQGREIALADVGAPGGSVLYTCAKPFQ